MKVRGWIGVFSVTALLVAAVAYLAWQVREVREDLLQARWQLEIANHTRDSKELTLDVGVIQFLPGGYSIALDSVSYEPAGVRLVGTVGNANALNVSSLTLNLEVRQPFWTRRDEFMRTHGGFDFILSDAATIGKVQVSVGDLGAGGQTNFRATVPNVQQSQSKLALAVSFSGERYAYLR